ncbi:HprK-related kinase [Pontimonas salivibrio]|uniref:HprK-related kinase n=1 Tax=Pontimonas salivibrio TaxID=1159327 RepID=A0A2L2BP83_9MICO|nr:hypothetical protein [Pontimonas salivibrio]AVG23458.1 HprK-related kinase [Pontimonas salivibrio]
MSMESLEAKTLWVRLDDGDFFDVVVTGWPEGVEGNQAPSVCGDYWPPFGGEVVDAPGGESSRGFSVDLDSVSSLLRFESDFGLYVAEKLDGYVAIHSALMVLGDHVVIVPGRSHAGKSSLTHAALGAGHRILSDEYTLVDVNSGRVRGWPRPIRRREPDGSITRVPIERDDALYAPTHVVDVRYSSDAEEVLALNPLEPGDVAFSLLENTLCAQSRPEESLRAIAAVSRQVKGLQGTRGEAVEALAALQELLGQS